MALNALEVLYVLGDHAARSETFIHREIADLVAAGVRLRLVSLWSSRQESQLGAPLVVVPRSSSARFWWSVINAFVRSRGRRRLIRETWRLRATERRGWFACLRWSAVALFVKDQLEAPLPDVVHAHFGSQPATVARLLAGLIDRPWGVSVHASDIYRDTRRLDTKLSNARHVVTCSDSASRDLVKLYPNIAPERIQTIHHGLDLQVWTPMNRRPIHPPRIIAAGRMVPKKGFETLIEACARLRDQSLPFQCSIVGDGPGAPGLRQQVEQLQLQGHVDIRPWMSAAELRTLLSTASAVAVPSIIAPDSDRDNIPNILVEAMACGVPTIASRLPAIERLTTPSAATFLVPPGDSALLASAMQRVCADEALGRRLSQAGRELAVKVFDRRASSVRVLAVLHEAAARSAGAGVPSVPYSEREQTCA